MQIRGIFDCVRVPAGIYRLGNELMLWTLASKVFISCKVVLCSYKMSDPSKADYFTKKAELLKEESPDYYARSAH